MTTSRSALTPGGSSRSAQPDERVHERVGQYHGSRRSGRDADARAPIGDQNIGGTSRDAQRDIGTYTGAFWASRRSISRSPTVTVAGRRRSDRPAGSRIGGRSTRHRQFRVSLTALAGGRDTQLVGASTAELGHGRQRDRIACHGSPSAGVRPRIASEPSLISAACSVR